MNDFETSGSELQMRRVFSKVARYPVICLSIEESVGVPWAVTCTLLLVLGLSGLAAIPFAAEWLHGDTNRNHQN